MLFNVIRAKGLALVQKKTENAVKEPSNGDTMGNGGNCPVGGITQRGGNTGSHPRKGKIGGERRQRKRGHD